MIIKFNGETSINKLGRLIQEVAEIIQEKAGLEKGTKIKVKDCQIGVLFEVNGEMNYLNVEHEGIKEIFQVNVELDKKGNIVKAVDNEEESFQDNYTRSVLKGLKSPAVGEIESVFNDEDLEFVSEINGGDLVEKTYNHKVTKEVVIRYYRNGILIGELGFKPKKEA